MIMANVEKKKWSLLEEIIKFTSKILFINNNVLKSIMIIKNFWINSETELTITIIRFFWSQVLLQNQKCEKKLNIKKDWKKQMNKIWTLNRKKSPNHPLNFFMLYLKNIKIKTQDPIPNFFITNMGHWFKHMFIVATAV